MLIIHNANCENHNISTIRTSSDSYIHWKNHFHTNPLYSRIYADFDANNAIDNSSIGNKTANVLKQNPLLNGYHLEFELEDVLKNEYYKSLLDFNNVD